MINRKNLKRVVLLAIAASFLYPVCSVMLRMRPRALDKSEIATYTGLKLPASAQVMNSKAINALQDKRLYAKIRLNADDVDDFVASLPAETDVSRKEVYSAQSEAGLPWWNLGTPDKYVSFSGRPPVGSSMVGTVDLDDKSNGVLYLYVIW